MGYAYDKFGLAESMNKKLVADKESTQEIKYSYDAFDRVTKINYGSGEEKSFKYDDRGKVLSIETMEKDKPTFVTKFSYDEFDKVDKKVISRVKADGKKEDSVYTYSYTNSGKLLTEKISFPDGTSRNIKRSYDKFGRLTGIKDTDKSVKYAYDKKSKLIEETIDNIPVHYTYTKYGQLESKVMGDDIKNPIGSLKYFYEKDGTLIGRVVNGSVQNFSYDKKGQLLNVTDLAGKVLESYTYDSTGNILEKVVNNKKTTFTYDKANQLVTSTDADGKKTNYKYDAAGHLSQEATGDMAKNYSYGWLDKVTKVDNGTAQSVFNYFPDGQLAEKVVGSDTERFYWDGLALIKRDSREFTNEPAVTGGNPVIANNKVMLNDMLGNSIGAYDKEYQAIDRTAFGETSAKADIDFFTGKPNIEGLGYSFLFRNYRQDLGKWQTADPLGFPDGLNNFAYINNRVTDYIDWLGAARIKITTATSTTILNNPTASNFVATLNNIKNNNGKVTELHIIGHGSSDSIAIDDSDRTIYNSTPKEGETVMGIENGKVILTDYGPNGVLDLDTTKDITSTLRDAMATGSEIYLDGCNTAQSSKWIGSTETDVSKEMSKILTDANISGNTGMVLDPGIGWITIGDKQTYRKGVPE